MPKVSPSVLIIRLDGIGDALALTPLLAALRRRGIPVDVVLRRTNAAAFSSHALRQAIVATFRLRDGSAENLASIRELGRRCSATGYSHVLVATEDPGGYRLAAATEAPHRIGFADPLGKPFKALWTRRMLTSSVYRSAGLDRKGRHESETLFALAAPLLGDDVPTRDAAELRPMIIDSEPKPGERIAIQVTDKFERAGIPFAEVVELVRRLQSIAKIRLIASENERSYAQRVADAVAEPLSAYNDLAPWKSAIAAAPAIVTPDSGALHVAGMVGTPVVAVFPAQRHLALQVARWAPWAAPHRIVTGDAGWPTRAADALIELAAL